MFDYHRKNGYADLYSLHSWCGILVFVLYFVQVSPFSPTAMGEGTQGGEPGLKQCVCHTRLHFPGCVPKGERVALVQLDAAFRF